MFETNFFYISKVFQIPRLLKNINVIFENIIFLLTNKHFFNNKLFT